MQGFNMGRYVPPDLEGVVSFNAASGKGHALGSRARKLKTEGILTVRFECPFAIWCTNCQPEQIIGQGVRFNAEKKKVGNYYSTAIWSFRFKHTVCGGWIEVRTDPKNAEYVVVEGGRRRDLGLEKVLEGETVLVKEAVSEEEKARFEKEGGFAALEKKIEDKSVFTTQQKRLEELLKSSERDWADPYQKSQLLRKEFRVGRRKRQADEKTGEALQEKFGLGVDLLAETIEDAERAKFIDFGEQKETSAVAKPLFSAGSTAASTTNRHGTKRAEKKTKAAQKAEHQKSAFQDTLKTNTRITTDPFLREEKIWQPRAKRKRLETVDVAEEQAAPVSRPSLVDYESDSSS